VNQHIVHGTARHARESLAFKQAHLQHEVEHVGMCFLHFVKENNSVWSFRQKLC
jgi:hypothetical protein